MMQKVILTLAALTFLIGMTIMPSVTLASSHTSPLDRPFGLDPQNAGFGDLVRELFRFGLILLILAAAIYIAIGAYAYLAASGDARMAELGKERIKNAITGLILGLISWIILNTVSPQFTKELKEPKLNFNYQTSRELFST